MNIWASNVYQIEKKKKNNFIPTNPPLSCYTLYILPCGPGGAFRYAPSLLARLYFFIRPSGGCWSPGGCQSTLILIRTWVLSGVNGSQQLSTRLSIPPHLIYHPRRALPTNTRVCARRWGKRLWNEKKKRAIWKTWVLEDPSCTPEWLVDRHVSDWDVTSDHFKSNHIFKSLEGNGAPILPHA